MDAWQQGKLSMPVQTIEQTMESLLSAKQGGLTTKQRAKIFHRKMLQGDVRGVVRYLTNKGKGDIFRPSDIDEKTGDSVKTVLRSKHPDARIPKPESLPHYAHTPDFVEVGITADTVEKVARRLSGSAGLRGTDTCTQALAAQIWSCQAETSRSPSRLHGLALQWLPAIMGQIPSINVRAALCPGQVPGCPSSWHWRNLVPCYGETPPPCGRS
jgi:hypothetical protein